MPRPCSCPGCGSPARRTRSNWPDPWNLNAYAYFACAAGDHATLAALLQRIGDDVVPQVGSNKGVALYELCKKDLAGSAH